MTLNTGTADYRNTHFEIKKATKINGEPTFDSLRKLHNELKINAQTIPSTRGGGAHGHLGLVLSAVDYQLITLQPFIRPNDPGDFTLPLNQNYTVEQITLLRETHREQRAEYDKVATVEIALKTFLVQAIDEDYLLEIRNSITRKLEGTIPIIIERLFATYGNLTSKKLLEKQNTLTMFTYDPHTPIDTIFRLAQDYQEYASFIGNPQTVLTLITYVYEILRRTGRFNKYLEQWNDKPDNEKTWDNFKHHCRSASRKLKEFSSETTANAGFNTNVINEITSSVANLLQTNDATHTDVAQQFLQNLTNAVNSNQESMAILNTNFQTLQDNMQAMNAARATPSNIAPHPNVQPHVPPTPPPMQFQPPSFTPPQQQPMRSNYQNRRSNTNQPVWNPSPHTFQPNWNQNQQPTFQQNRPNQHNWNPNQHQQPSFQQNRPNPQTRSGNNKRRNNHYCWTHGACNHQSSACNQPHANHVWHANFRNRMGGNPAGCWT